MKMRMGFNVNRLYYYTAFRKNFQGGNFNG